MIPRLAPLCVLACALVSGCSTEQSALAPMSPQAAALDALAWLLFATAAAIWLAVTVAFLAAALRRRPQAEPPAASAGASRPTVFWIVSAMAATTVTIAALTLASFVATRSLSTSGEPLTIRLTGYQWWWEASYPADGAAGSFVVANELHVPVGRPVRIELASADVIHSFWVPQLGGKQDLIPGRANAISFSAERPGVYRGQCAEFCGLQHAHMALLVVAEPDDAFDAWRRRQAGPAEIPADPEAAQGARLFAAKPCAACHTVRGTAAQGRAGPDLTHVGGRRQIAAGLLETTRGALAAWIADPQALKPGSNMPAVSLTAEELRAISAYMAALR